MCHHSLKKDSSDALPSHLSKPQTTGRLPLWSVNIKSWPTTVIWKCRNDLFANNPIDLPLNVLLNKPPKKLHAYRQNRLRHPKNRFHADDIDITQAAYRVLHLPAVAAKTWLPSATTASAARPPLTKWSANTKTP